MVAKLQQQLQYKEVTNRLASVNQSFQNSMKSMISNEKNSLTKMLDSFNSENPLLDSKAYYKLSDL